NARLASAIEERDRVPGVATKRTTLRDGTWAEPDTGEATAPSTSGSGSEASSEPNPFETAVLRVPAQAARLRLEAEETDGSGQPTARALEAQRALRDIAVEAESVDTYEERQAERRAQREAEPAAGQVYIAPETPPAAYDKTLEMQTVHVKDSLDAADSEADERRATTQRNLRAPARRAPGAREPRKWWPLIGAAAIVVVVILIWANRSRSPDPLPNIASAAAPTEATGRPAPTPSAPRLVPTHSAPAVSTPSAPVLPAAPGTTTSRPAIPPVSPRASARGVQPQPSSAPAPTSSNGKPLWFPIE
ncbi:MAG: hypothetical protein KC776_43895, partial [Myxococcales bacterium]|nr:hypothetical protein [Myxococcales bacterium]